MDKADIADDVLPLLSKCNLSNPTVLMSVTSKFLKYGIFFFGQLFIFQIILLELYKQLLECPSICPSVDCIATNILPNLIPATVNHNLTLEQVSFFFKLLNKFYYHLKLVS